jgi:tRNA(fMet)-specific endonuclease VapC
MFKSDPKRNTHHFGAEKSQARERALSTIEQLTQVIPACPLPLEAGEHHGQIRAALQQQGLPIGNNDLWLAAHARSQGWILVTNNTHEFARVPGLQVENWVD